MTTFALLFLLLLQTRWSAPLYRVHVRADGIWWMTYFVGGSEGRRVLSWAFQPRKWEFTTTERAHE